MRFTNANWANHNAFVAANPGGRSRKRYASAGRTMPTMQTWLPMATASSPDPFEYPSCARCVAPVADEWKCLRGKFDFTGNAAELYVGDDLAVDSAADGWHSGNGTFPRARRRSGSDGRQRQHRVLRRPRRSATNPSLASEFRSRSRPLPWRCPAIRAA